MEHGEEVFENTFASECSNPTLTLNEIIGCMKFGVFKYDSLPARVRNAVDRELEREDELRAKYGTPHPDPNNEWELDVLDVKLEFAQRKTEQLPDYLLLNLHFENVKKAMWDLKDKNDSTDAFQYARGSELYIDRRYYDDMLQQKNNSREGRNITQSGQSLLKLI